MPLTRLDPEVLKVCEMKQEMFERDLVPAKSMESVKDGRSGGRPRCEVLSNYAFYRRRELCVEKTTAFENSCTRRTPQRHHPGIGTPGVDAGDYPSALVILFEEVTYIGEERNRDLRRIKARQRDLSRDLIGR